MLIILCHVEVCIGTRNIQHPPKKLQQRVFFTMRLLQQVTVHGARGMVQGACSDHLARYETKIINKQEYWVCVPALTWSESLQFKILISLYFRKQSKALQKISWTTYKRKTKNRWNCWSGNSIGIKKKQKKNNSLKNTSSGKQLILTQWP